MVTEIAGLVEEVTDRISVGLMVTTEKGRLVWVNRALRDLVGVDADAGWAVVREATSVLPVRHVETGTSPREISWTTPAGYHRWLRIAGRKVSRSARNGEPGQDWLLYEITDITEGHKEIERARNGEWRLSRIEALARIGTWEWDLTKNDIVMSEELLRTFGYPPEAQLDYEDYRAMLYPDDRQLIEDTLDEALRTGGPFNHTQRMYLADGVTLRVFECYGEVFTDEGGTPVRMLGTAHDITDTRRVQDELAYLAEHDPLTGLANRRAITNRLREQLKRGSVQPGRCGALLLIDVDNFKDINDLQGHAVGDKVMRSLAQLLREHTAEGAVLGRLGGDEFAIVLPEADPGEALGAAESVCDTVARTPVFTDGAALRITASIGVAPIGPDSDCDVLLARADLALYEAKDSGRNRARLFAPEQYYHAAQRVSVLQRVRGALDTGTMTLDAQPIVDLTTRTVTSYELLIRLRDGLEPALAPAEFLPAVERTDLILELDRWVIGQAVAALAAPGARHSGLRLEVNVSSRSLDDPEFGQWVVHSLRAADVQPALLGLEITETAAITSLDAARRLADRLIRAGCRFTLDDFGAGFGSFVYLKHLPFTGVKIAGEFARNADCAATDTVLVDAVVRAARGLGMRTIAEYVDREPLVGALRDLGVDHGQGFHLGRPSPLVNLLTSP